MPNEPPGPRELGRYMALAQVGVEMVSPVVAGLILDYYLNWSPWGTIVGAIVGLVGGLAHLIAIVSREDDRNSSQRRRDAP